MSKKSKIVLVVSSILTIISIVCITLLQLDSYYETDYVKKVEFFCGKNKLLQIDYLSTLISLLLIIFYIILNKRRSLLRDKFKFKYIGIPMIVSCWSKKNRLYSSLVYGLIALNVFETLKNILTNDSDESQLFDFDDPTGLIDLFRGGLEILLTGLSKF